MPNSAKRAPLPLIARIRMPRLHVGRLVKAALRHARGSVAANRAAARARRESDKH